MSLLGVLAAQRLTASAEVLPSAGLAQGMQSTLLDWERSTTLSDDEEPIMSKVLVVLAPGFEEIEATTIIDVLRRGNVEVTVAGLHERAITGSHQIRIEADALLGEVDASSYDALVLPGGLPGAHHLRDDERVMALVRRFDEEQKLVGAICAAPLVLEAAGVLSGRRATSYPGQELPSARYEEEAVVRDGHILTSRGVGTALDFACQLVACLESPRLSETLAARMLVSR